MFSLDHLLINYQLHSPQTIHGLSQIICCSIQPSQAQCETGRVIEKKGSWTIRSSSLPKSSSYYAFLPSMTSFGLTLICLGLVSSALGMFRVSTPFSKVASALSVCNELGSKMLRLNAP